jgi:hypothetical protein
MIDSMTKGTIIFGAVAVSILITLTVIFLSINKNREENTVESLTTLLEYAYMEGQRDYMDGDIRIEKNSYGDYVWIKSPWNQGDEPTYQTLREYKEN